VSEHPPKGTVKDVMDWTEWYVEVQMMAAGTSSQPPLKKDK